MGELILGRGQARERELLDLAADALDEGVDPFTGEWLSSNGVTLTEALNLATNVAECIRDSLWRTL